MDLTSSIFGIMIYSCWISAPTILQRALHPTVLYRKLKGRLKNTEEM